MAARDRVRKETSRLRLVSPAGAVAAHAPAAGGVPLLGILSALEVGLFAGFTASTCTAATVILYAYASPSMQRDPCRG